MTEKALRELATKMGVTSVDIGGAGNCYEVDLHIWGVGKRFTANGAHTMVECECRD